MKAKKITALLMTMIMCFSLAACGGNDSGDGGDAQGTDKKEITLACVETTQALVAEVVPVMEEQGYTVKYQVFDNNINTLAACNDGSVDAVFVVHKPFMESFNEGNDGDLVMLEPYVYTSYMGLFSEKYDSIDEIPDGATIAIPNDAMNMDRALRILASGGLITLEEDVEQCSTTDIKENPKELQFMDMDQTQTVRSLEDTDAVVAFFSHMRNAGKDFNTYLLRDSDPNAYPTALVVKEENKDAQWAIDLNNAFLNDDIKAFAEEYYGGLYEYYE